MIGLGLGLTTLRNTNGWTITDGGPVVPLGAIQQRDGSYILDRSGDNITVRT